MIGLLFKIMGDMSPFRKAMTDTKKEAHTGGETVGKAFGAQFKAGMMRFVGAGAIISTFVKAAKDALQIDAGAIKLNVSPEAFQELTKAAEMLGMSVDELRQVAPEAAKEFEDMMSKIREGGGILDSQTVEMLADTADAFDELWTKIQPGLGFIAKTIGWLVGQGQRVATANAGMAMAGFGSAKRLLTGDSTEQQAGVELYREARATSVPFGSSPISSDRRAAARRLSSALQANRQLVASSKQEDAATAAGVGNLPFMGGVMKDMVSVMWKVAEEQKRTREEIARRL